MIVSKSANLQTSNDQWNPNQILKTHMQSAGTAPATAPPPSPQAVVPPAGVHPQVQQQVFAQPQMQQPQIMHVVTREFVEKKLDIILATLAQQEHLDKKITNFVDRGLKDRVKQITLKLDDIKD